MFNHRNSRISSVFEVKNVYGVVVKDLWWRMCFICLPRIERVFLMCISVSFCSKKCVSRYPAQLMRSPNKVHPIMWLYKKLVSCISLCTLKCLGLKSNEYTLRALGCINFAGCHKKNDIVVPQQKRHSSIITPVMFHCFNTIYISSKFWLDIC